MLSVNIREARGTRALVVKFLAARDGGREVRFAILDPHEPVRLSEIVVSSVALGTQRYDIHTLNADIAEQALAALHSYHSVPKILYDATQQNNTTSAEVLSLYYVKITSTQVALDPKHGADEHEAI